MKISNILEQGFLLLAGAFLLFVAYTMGDKRAEEAGRPHGGKEWAKSLAFVISGCCVLPLMAWIYLEMKMDRALGLALPCVVLGWWTYWTKSKPLTIQERGWRIRVLLDELDRLREEERRAAEGP